MGVVGAPAQTSPLSLSEALSSAKGLELRQLFNVQEKYYGRAALLQRTLGRALISSGPEFFNPLLP